MTDFPNGRHTLWLVHKLIDEGSLDPSSEGPSVPEKKQEPEKPVGGKIFSAEDIDYFWKELQKFPYAIGYIFYRHNQQRQSLRARLLF